MPLSKERVLCAAVQLADQAGVASLPMRKLAETLGVEAMSLYHYITDKDEILDGMVDLVFGEIELPSLEADWKATMRQRAISARDALVRHPWAIGVLESRANPGPAAAGRVLSSGSPPAHNEPVRPLIRGPWPPPGGRVPCRCCWRRHSR